MMIIGILALLVAVGVYTITPQEYFDSMSGMVVYSAADCSRCFGTPICAVKGQRAINYESACAATCDNARVIYDDFCEKIPKAN